MATYIVTITSDERDILFQEAAPSEEAVQQAAVNWMAEWSEEHFSQEMLEGMLGKGYSVAAAFAYIKKIGDEVEGAPQLVVRKSGA